MSPPSPNHRKQGITIRTPAKSYPRNTSQTFRTHERQPGFSPGAYPEGMIETGSQWHATKCSKRAERRMTLIRCPDFCPGGGAAEGEVRTVAGGRTAVKRGGRNLYQCNACRKQTSVKAGTVRVQQAAAAHGKAMYLMTQSKKGIPASNSGGGSASRRQAPGPQAKARPGHDGAQRGQALKGEVQMDDAYLAGSAWSVWPRGQDAFLAAVSNRRGQTRSDSARRVAGCNAAIVECGRGARRASCRVRRARCFRRHKSRLHPYRDQDRQRTESGQTPPLKWVNTVLGNVKAAMVGTYRAVRDKHAPRYLAESNTASTVDTTSTP